MAFSEYQFYYYQNGNYFINKNSTEIIQKPNHNVISYLIIIYSLQKIKILINSTDFWDFLSHVSTEVCQTKISRYSKFFPLIYRVLLHIFQFSGLKFGLNVSFEY